MPDAVEKNWPNILLAACLTILMALSGWTLTTTQRMAVELSVAQVRIESVREQMNIVINDRYTKSEATSDRALINSVLSELGRDIEDKGAENLRQWARINDAEEQIVILQQQLRELGFTNFQ